jgi:hypothetical protein
MTATVAGQALTAKLKAMLPTLGAYPHAGMIAAVSEAKQGTRLLKVSCPECGYTIRVTAKWIDVGLPQCCCGVDMEVAA